MKAKAARQQRRTGELQNCTFHVSGRWADDNEGFGEELTESELSEVLERAGLPHCRAQKPDPVQPAPVYPETEEPEDALTAEGLRLGRALGGRGGLPGRLAQRDVGPAVEGRLYSRSHATVSACSHYIYIYIYIVYDVLV